MSHQPRSRSFKVAALVTLTVGGVLTNPLPAAASTLALSSFTCTERRAELACEVYFSGGTGGNTYFWNQPTRFRTDYADHTKAWVACEGVNTTVAVFATDSSGTTASVNQVVSCMSGTR